MNLSCIIIDDEPCAIKLLELLIRERTGWQLSATCYDALEALEFLKSNKVDFLFLDINMPQLTGLELAALLPTQTKIVFTTAYSEHAVESYNYQTVDYLLKPITLKRFMASVQKIEKAFSVTGSSDDASFQKEYFFVKSGKVLSRILLSDILYFEGEKEYVRLVTAKEQLLIYRRLKDIQEQLAPPFARVHNSYIVNTRMLNKIQDNHVFIGGKQISMSEKFKDDFMAIIQQRIF
jgi:DNA-binding LytR/AlgR family response regulator